MAQQNNGNDLEKLYNAVSEKFDIGDYSTFSSKMQTSDDRLKFYNTVSEKGFDLGDYNSYEDRLGKLTGVSPQGSDVTSEGFVEPIVPTEASPIAPTEQELTQNTGLSDQSLVDSPIYHNASDIGKHFVGGMNFRGVSKEAMTKEDELLSERGERRYLVDIPYDDSSLGVERTAEFILPEGVQVVSPRLSQSGGQYQLQYLDAEGNRLNALEVTSVTSSPRAARLKNSILFDESTDTGYKNNMSEEDADVLRSEIDYYSYLSSVPLEDWTDEDKQFNFDFQTRHSVPTANRFDNPEEAARGQELLNIPQSELTPEEAEYLNEYLDYTLSDSRRLTDDQQQQIQQKAVAESHKNTLSSSNGLVRTLDAIGRRAVEGLGREGARMLSGVLGVDEFLFDTITEVSRTLGSDAPTYNEAFGRNAVRTYLDDAVARNEVYNSIVYGTEGVYESLKSGNIMNAVGKTADAIGGSGAYMGTMMLGNTGVLAAYAGTAVGKYVEEQTNNPNGDRAKALLLSHLWAASEIVPEKIGLNAMVAPYTRLAKEKGIAVAEDALSKSLRHFLGRYHVLTPHATEILTETTTMLLQNGMEGNNLLEGWEDTLIISGVMSGAVSTPGQVMTGISNKKNRKEAESLLKENEEISNTLKSGNVDPLSQIGLKNTYIKNIAKINGFVEAQLELKGSLNDREVDIVNGLESQKSDLISVLFDPNVSDLVKNRVQEQIDEIDDQIETLVTTVEPSTEIAPEVVDERIATYRENNPNVELENPMDTIPESVENVMSRIDDNLPVDPVSAKETSDTLYAKYKELSDMKSDPNRTLTIAEIDGYMEQLGADIEVLENYTTEGTPVQEQIQENETTETEIQPETTQEVSEVSLESSEVAPVAESTAVTKELVVDDSKQRQFDIIQASNPAPNAVNTWVRSPEDILTAEEAFTPAREDGAVYPDFSVEDMDVALSSGEVTVYSSYPIADGVFVTPSKMNAESYSGDGKVHSKTIPISDVAWIDEGEGQYAPVSTSEPEASAVDSVDSVPVIESPVAETATTQTPTEFENEGQYYDYILKSETNPDVVAQAYDSYTTTDEGDMSYIEAGISDYGLGKVNERDYARWGDRNNLEGSNMRRTRVDRNNGQIGIDVIAMEISDRLGVEVSPQDIIDFIDKFPTAQSIRDAREGSMKYNLAQRYAELTGNNLTPTRVKQSLRNLDEGRTDQERFEESSLPEQGVTFEETQDRREYEEETAPRGRAAKGALKGVSDRLAKTGLARSIQMRTSEEISSELGVDGSSVNGYVDSEGNIILNSETASLDTPIHEVSHVWERTIEQSNPAMHARGMELIAGPDGKVYVDHVRDTQPGLEGRELYKEALAQAIGDRGARLIESQKNGPIKEWLKKAWEFIGDLVGISGMTSSEIANLTLNQYADAVAADLLQGKPLVKLPSGDIVTRTTARTEDQMDNVDKFMADFVERMKAKNGVNFQGTVSGELSAEDFTDLTTYFRHSLDKGLISTVDEARIMARSMGIASPAEVDMAFKLAKTRGVGAVGFKKSEVSPETLKNTNFDKLTDEEYREFGKRLVDEGLVDPQQLVAEIIDTPRALQPWEVTALQYYRSNIESEMAKISSKLDSNDANYTYRVGGETITGYKAMAQRMAFINEALFDLEVAMLTTANQQSAAFRLRSVMADKDFNIVQFLAEMKARGAIDPDLEQKLINLSNELNVVRAKLKEKSRQVDELQEQISTGNINHVAQQPERRRRVKPKKEVLSAIELTLDTIDPTAFGLPGMTFQANNVIRFQTNSSQSLSDAVSGAVASMRSNISEGRMNVADAIEQAVSDINSAVGEGNWDAIKFKSQIANSLVGQSVPVRMKSPYVNTNGRLVVPGAYITDIARNGADTIDKMVQQVSDDLGGRYSDYDIRNAISGYGRETAKNRTDLDRAISKARRVARLLSQIEDLETKGERLKTRKQIDNNDSEIEGLRQEVKRLEYDLEMTPEERDQLAEQRYNEGRRKYLEGYISDIRQRIDEGDFAPKTRKNRYEEDAETRALRVEAERIKNEFKKEKYRHELETRPIDEKIREYAYDLIFNITRALSAGFDASAIGVQAFIFSAARPKQALGVLRSSMKGSFSEAEYDTYFANLQADPLYEVARKAKLNLQLPSFYQSVQEEQFKGSIPAYLLDYVTGGAGEFVAKMTGGDVVKARQFAQDKFNLAKIADRNYSLVLSKVRMDLFREFIGNQVNKRGLDVELDAAEVARVAEVVNTITMASKVPGVEGKTANDIVSMIMFSARKFIATWKVLGAWVPLAINNRQLLKDAYGSVIGRGLGTLFTIAAMPNIMGTLMAMYSDDEDEEQLYWYNKNWMNPKHSDFLKIRLGNTRISLFNGIDGNIVFATRFLSGEYMTSSSEAVKELGGASNNKTRGGLSWEYISNKFAPTTSILTNHFLYSDREKQESYERFKESFAPMWATGMYEQYVNTGHVGETMALGAAGFFGLAYNNYGGAEFAMGPGTDNIKARGIFDRSGLSAYDPGNGTRKYFNGTDESAVKGKNYDDIYLPAYQEFMREAVISNEQNFSRDKHWEYKEGLVNSMKREAYKHAELELSGVVSTSAFKDLSYDGQKYVIPKSLYSVKADYIKDYMDKNKREIPLYIQDLKYEFSERAGVKPTKRYLEMLAQNELYKEAHREANARMIEDMEAGKITLIPKDEYVSSEDNFEDE